MNDLINKNRKFIAIYLLWFFIHLVFLFLSDKEYSEYFWPFEAHGYLSGYVGSLNHAYDFSEFLVYAIGPFILVSAYLIISKKN